MDIWDFTNQCQVEIDVKRSVYLAGEKIRTAVRGTIWRDDALAEWNRDHSTGARREFWSTVYIYLKTMNCCSTPQTRVLIIDDEGPDFRLRKPRWFRSAEITMFSDVVEAGTGQVTLRWKDGAPFRRRIRRRPPGKDSR